MLNRLFVLDNPVQPYAWGSRTAIAELLGRPAPSDQPQAELWMGAHPKAPSRVRAGGGSISLIDLIERHPLEILGEPVAGKFGPRLPFLFKVLAAAEPLSIQAHPGRSHAREGFARENRLGIPLDAPRRNYRDDGHKPECLLALTSFRALVGFRRIPEMLGLLSDIWPENLSPALAAFRDRRDPGGLKIFFESLLGFTGDLKDRLLEIGVERARRFQAADPAFAWVATLNKAYPGDIGALCPLLLNLVDLQPGEAVFLSAGQLHAYLKGVGMELMANSDNVLRGGLTPKHVDVAELLKVVSFDPLEVEAITPERIRDGETTYPTPAEEFGLSVITVSPRTDYLSSSRRSIEILICLQGDAAICDLANSEKIRMPRGCCVMVPAVLERYRITGDASICKAFVP